MQRAPILSGSGPSCQDLREWRGIISDIYQSLDLEVKDERTFRAKMSMVAFPRINIAIFEADGERVTRNRTHIRKESEEHFYLSIGTYGAARICQHSREGLLRRGSFTLLHSGTPYEYEHPDPIGFVSVKIPASTLLARHSDPHALCGTAMPGSPGLPGVIFRLVQTMVRDADLRCGGQAKVVEESLLDLIGLVLDKRSAAASPDGTSVRRGVRHRASSFIKDNLDHLDLTPKQIAAAIGVSTRYLHDVFGDTEQTVSEHLKELRLNRSSRELAIDPGASLSIKEVAVRTGFRSQSHFTQLFRSRFGMTPSEYRRSLQKGTAQW